MPYITTVMNDTKGKDKVHINLDVVVYTDDRTGLWSSSVMQNVMEAFKKEGAYTESVSMRVGCNRTNYENYHQRADLEMELNRTIKRVIELEKYLELPYDLTGTSICFTEHDVTSDLIESLEEYIDLMKIQWWHSHAKVIRMENLRDALRYPMQKEKKLDPILDDYREFSDRAKYLSGRALHAMDWLRISGQHRFGPRTPNELAQFKLSDFDKQKNVGKVIVNELVKFLGHWKLKFKNG